MCVGPRLRKPISSQYTDYKAGRAGAALEPGLDSRAEEADLICLLTDGSPDHTQPPARQPCWDGVAAHDEVGEGAQAEEEMIVIEYEMSITWNERALRVGGRGCCNALYGWILLSWKQA